MIPRLLHRIWLGPRPAPAAWMDSWPTLNTDFAYRVWDEGEVDDLGLHSRAVYERYLSEGIFDGAADVARVEFLQRFGGIYVDTDSEAVRPLGGADRLDARFFAVAEPGDDEPIVSSAFMGSEPGHVVLGAYIDTIAAVVHLRPMWRLIGPGALTEVLRSHRGEGVVILPPSVFFDTTLDGQPVPRGGTHGRHFFLVHDRGAMGAPGRHALSERTGSAGSGLPRTRPLRGTGSGPC